MNKLASLNSPDDEQAVVFRGSIDLNSSQAMHTDIGLHHTVLVASIEPELHLLSCLLRNKVDLVLDKQAMTNKVSRSASKQCSAIKQCTA